MTTKNVTFDYSVDQANFTTSADIDAKAWDDADSDERLDMLRDAAMEDVEDMLVVDEGSIDDSED